MNAGQLKWRAILADFVVIFCLVGSSIAGSQEISNKHLSVGDIEGTWYGWFRGNGLEVKLSQYPNHVDGVMRLADQSGKISTAMELAFALSGDTVQLHGPAMTGTLHLEGRLLHGTLSSDKQFTTVTFARSMPDVESLFQGQHAEQEPQFQSPNTARGVSANNLKQLGIIMKMFANENKDSVFPRLDPRPGHLMMSGPDVFPEYVTDVRVFVSPAHPGVQRLTEQSGQNPLSIIDDHSYWYLGYAVTTEEAGLAFVEAYRSAIARGEAPNGDLEDAVTGMIPRLREGVERFFIADINNPAASAQAQAQIPVIIERPGLQKGGSCVLFMDGHTEFIEYPGRFPMTDRFIRALQSLDELKRPESNAAG
ncbi:MAG: hypothetical protein IT365_15590 [Candidatus Hydrogenedentes bacterium]|nr:hypothetical protein [Candidatus Hydrogenedentota bacterium]